MGRTFPPQFLGRMAVVAALAFLAIWTLWSFLPALGWAAVLAIATWPARQWLTRNGRSETRAAILLTATAGLLIVGPLLIVVIEATRESVVLLHWLRELRQTGIPTPEGLAQLPLAGSYLAAWWQEHLADPAAARALLGRTETLTVTEWTRHLGHELIHRLIILGFTLLTLLFVYRDGPRLTAQIRNVSDRLLGVPAQRLGHEAIGAVRATVNGLVLVGLAEGAVLGIAYLAAGLPHALMFAFATGIFATVPFGAPAVFIIACLILFAQSKVTAAVLVLIFATLVVFVADHFVRPVLIGRSARLPFLWVLLGIFGGLETFGLLGLFLGPAIMAAALTLWREAAEPRALDDPAEHQAAEPQTATEH
ncbi:MAG TPA: AI-2E family transporter [Xanthobacteraceae bacterium]